MSKIAIIYHEDHRRFEAQAIASVIKPGLCILSKDGSDIQERILFSYFLHSSYIKDTKLNKYPYIVDHDHPRDLPNMKNRNCLLHVTHNPYLALTRLRTFQYPPGIVYKQLVTMARARASMPISKGMWVYVDDLKKAKAFMSKHSGRGYTYLNVNREEDLIDKKNKIFSYKEQGNNNETLWNVLMASNVIVHFNRSKHIYLVSGRKVLTPPRFEPIDYLPDMEAANRRLIKRNYVNRTRVIINELAKYHPYGDRIKEILV